MEDIQRDMFCERNVFRRILPFLLIAIIGIPLPSQGQTSLSPASFAPIGLPSSRSPSPVFNRYAALPPFTAQQPRRGEWILVPTLEIGQLMTSLLITSETEPPEFRSLLDYETISLELPVSYGLGDAVSLEADVQIQYVWGGFLDGPIEWFHELFGFPNAGRQETQDGQVVVDVDTKNGYALRLDRAALLISDPVVGIAVRIVRRTSLDLTGRFIGAVPLGLGGGVAGADLPQLGAGIYADWRPSRRVSAHLLLGGVLPLESLIWTGDRPYPVAQVRASVFLETARGIYLFLDGNFKSSPSRGFVTEDGRDFFGQPNADILIGIAISGRRSRERGGFGAFSVQEDPFSHNASDVRFIGAGAFRFP